MIVNKLNRKGYMLIEIILASVLAFAIAYYVMNITIKLKNKNDDLLVETLVSTDQTIINNKLMNYAMNEGANFDCSKLVVNKNNNTITYNSEVIDVVNDYAILGDNVCEVKDGTINIFIPLTIVQKKDKDYVIDVSYKYDIGDKVPPSATLRTINGSCNAIKIELHGEDDNSGFSHMSVTVKKDGTIDNDKSNNNITVPSYTIDLQDIGTYQVSYNVVDKAGNVSATKTETYTVSNEITSSIYTFTPLTGSGGSLVKDGKIYIKKSGTLKFNCAFAADIFMVGGGGAGAKGGIYEYAGGGGGGYTKTVKDFGLSIDKTYSVVIGLGGTGLTTGFGNGGDGLATSFDSYSVNGGSGGIYLTRASQVNTSSQSGGNGGSGGGGYGHSFGDTQVAGGTGGSDGGNGVNTLDDNGGKGQGTTTREFGDADGILYAGGGGGRGGITEWWDGYYPWGEVHCGTCYPSPSGQGGAGGGGDGASFGQDSSEHSAAPAATSGEANTGGGGGGGDDRPAGDGGSGVVVIRMVS